MACKYYINGLTLSKDEFLNYVKKQPLEESAKVLGITATPSAPFITDTNKYIQLGLKVALKEAVKQGADKIAWTTGEQQADRYSLAEQVNSILVTPNKNGRFVFIDMKGNYDVTLSVDGNGKILEDKNNLQGQQTFAGKSLDDVVGKDMAQKILSETKESKYEGEGLKVGGTGMKGFYGSPTEGSLGIVGNVAKSLFKQEPKTVSIKTAKNNEYTLGEANYIDGIGVYDGKGDMVAEFDTKAEANKFISDKSNQTQHSIDITPELKKQVSEGLPLFMRTSDGNIFGFEYKGKIFLDKNAINADTPIHEVVGHYGMNIIDAMAKGGDEKAKAVIQKGMMLLQDPEGKAVLDEIKANPTYSSLSNREHKLEALATIIGREGANMFAVGTSKTTFASKVKDFIKSFYDYIRTQVPTLKDKTIKQIVAMDNKEFIRAIVGDAFRGEIVDNNESVNPNTNDIRFQAEPSIIATEINDLFNEGLDKTEIREVLIDSGYSEAEVDKELDLFNEGESPENLPYDDTRKYKGKTDGEIVEEILNREINPSEYPSILNLENEFAKKQQTAKTTEDIEKREIDGQYITASLTSLQKISLENVLVLKKLLGEKWMDKVLTQLEKKKYLGNSAQVIGIMNIMSTEINQDLQTTENAKEASKLKRLQKRVDNVANTRLRESSLALNMKRLMRQFAKGGSIKQAIAETILSKEQIEFANSLEQAMASTPTDEQLNNSNGTTSNRNGKGGTSSKTKTQSESSVSEKEARRIVDDKANTAGIREDENGNKVKKSAKELFNDAFNKINNIRGCK